MGTGIPEDLPTPELEELQQRDVPLPALLVKPDGPVTVHELPAKAGPMFKQALTTDFQHVLGADLKRGRTVLLADADWEISTNRNAGSGVPWPADVPMYVPHCDVVYARVPTSTGNLSVVTGVWAD
jgi:hypothetical protein